MRVRVLAYLVLTLTPAFFLACAINHISSIHHHVADHAIEQAAAIDALEKQIVAQAR